MDVLSKAVVCRKIIDPDGINIFAMKFDKFQRKNMTKKTKEIPTEMTNKEQVNTVDNAKNSSHKNFALKSIAQIIYLCQMSSFFFGITAIAGVILNYLKRNEVKGTWLESHFMWQIKTFWVGLIASLIGYFLIFVLIGFLILAVTLVWIIYRVIKGYLLLLENKPIESYQKLI